MAKDHFDRQRFGIGQSAPRKEDPTLLRGEGRYSDDFNVDGQVYLAFVYSPVAHGRIDSIDVSDARDAEGVLGVWTGADLKDQGLTMPDSMSAPTSRDGSDMRQPPRHPLAVDKVRYVGDPVVCIAAQTAAQARDAAELVMLEIDDLAVVTDAEAAADPDAPQLFDEVPGNRVVEYFDGDAEAVDAGFSEAAKVARLRLEDPRIIINPMELRACLAEYDGARDHFTISTQTQGVFPFHNEAARCLGVSPDQVSVITGSVGGSFGMRIVTFPEQICALFAARALNRPVKWLEERTSSFLTDYHGRANRYDCALALDAEGRMLAMRIEGFANLGGYLNPNGLSSPAKNVMGNLNSMYRLPALSVGVKCMVTNTPPVGAYRGAGRQAANYIMERMVEEAARVTGIDRVALRRINQIRPEELPYTSLTGQRYDSGDFTALMDETLKAADLDGFADRREASRKAGKLRGFGIGCFLEATSLNGKELGRIRFEANGDVSFVTGTLDFGQGHASTFAQIIGEKLGIPFERINLIQGDSDEMPDFGGYTGGSRSVIASGNAALKASDMVIDKALQLAPWALDTNANDITFEDGQVKVTSTGTAISLIDLARRLREATDLPAGLPQSLESEFIGAEGAGPTFPNGCHICEVEIDEATGETRIDRYLATNDVGQVVNPLLLEGQVHGGIMQGIGQALMERVIYDDEGQLLSGSFTDYCMPRADDVPFFDIRNRSTQTALNGIGAKGVGESGCAGSLGSVMNAVIDALSTVGVTHIDMPATPETVWRAIQDARKETSRQ
ncbi:xanthine dehydrogenase family protein molybdopterin-binding subunit [Antarctobacter sp.]|uniref:xanthine dehydrogenase family protein molybdopterin-binding subunit n=1 Tax=Antarctobacter sp. TaxID=1872577 RepID=UPI003A8E605E